MIAPLYRQAPAAARTGIADVLSLLWRRKLLILVTSVGFAGLAYGASLLIPPSYVATTALFVDSRSIQPIASAPGQTPNSDNNFEVSFIESQAKIITSTSVLSRVVAAQGLVDDPVFAGTAQATIVDRIKRLLGAPPAEVPSPERKRLTALAALADRVTVRRPERTFTIDVSVRAPAADTAARLANAVAQAYFDEQAAARTENARRANDALTSRLDALRDRVRQSQARAQTFKEKHGLIGTRLQLSSEQQLTEANAQLAQARSQRTQSRAHLDELARRDGGGFLDNTTPEALTSPTIAQLRSKQADLKRQLDSMAQFGPRHPGVSDAKQQLAGIEQLIQAELTRIRQAAQVEYQRAAAAEKTSQTIVDRLSGEAAKTSSALAQATQLQQEVEINKNLLNTFIGRAREMGEMEQIDTSTARVISVAEPPFSRASPPRGIVFVVVGAVLGFWVAVAQVILKNIRRLSVFGGGFTPAIGPIPQPRVGHRELVS